MGGISSRPKIPALPPAPTVADVSKDGAVYEDRLRRQKASGRTSNIVSSLSERIDDTTFKASISKLG